MSDRCIGGSEGRGRDHLDFRIRTSYSAAVLIDDVERATVRTCNSGDGNVGVADRLDEVAST